MNLPVKRVDMHVHIVGNGARGSGCWLRPTGWYALLGRFMCRQIGLVVRDFADPEFDARYVAKLLEWLRGSSLQQAVILANDQVYHADGRLLEGAGTFYVPNDYVLQLARDHAEFLPAVSIHPARPDAVDELDRCVAAGAVMMKCLPNCHNINCNDPRYRKFWERMAAHRLPLLAHTGGEHVIPIIEPEYADPRILTLPLECGVTCIAAHCGGRALFDPEYFHVFTGMLKRYPNLYGDISAFNIPIRSRHFRACLRLERILHGSDYPVPVQAHWARLRGLIDRETYRRCQRMPNPLERDYQIKRAIGFPEDVFTRVGKLFPAIQ
jgi:hypothetical protein